MPDTNQQNEGTSEEGSSAQPEVQEPRFSFRRWYEEHGGELNKNRQLRYATDPEYKAKVLAQNQATRERKRRSSPKSAKQKDLVQKAWKTRPLVVVADGTEITVQGFTISAAAAILGCSVQALRLWEKTGKLPSTPYRYNGRDRLYTRELIEKYADLIQGKDFRERKYPSSLSVSKKVVRFSDGRTVETNLFRVDVLARAVGQTSEVLLEWEAAGTLPESPFQGAGSRLYTASMIGAVKTALQHRAGEPEAGMGAEIRAAWQALGVADARILTV
jgi:DNA-binding transcriptional MerR regulator